MGADLRLLLDTSTLISITRDPVRVAPSARAALDDSSNSLFISAASAWEIATKHRLGKLEQAHPLINDWTGELEQFRFEHVPVTDQHALRAGTTSPMPIRSTG